MENSRPGYDQNQSVWLGGSKDGARVKDEGLGRVAGVKLEDVGERLALLEGMNIDKVVPVAASVKTTLRRGGTGEE